MDQLVAVLCDWGLDTVFGMVGHSNLGLADALRKAEEDGRLTYIGIRHEGAAAFAASGYAKADGQAGRLLLTIAGPGATNLLTGLWDAKVDRVPIVALTGQVKTQVIGPGTFQEVDLAAAFAPVAEWSQTVLRPENATELAALAMKHAIVNRDVAHLIFPDEVQELDGLAEPPPRPMAGRVAAHRIAPPEAELERAVALLAERRASGDHLRQRRPRLRRRDRRVRRAPRRADHHHVQGEGSRARRPPAGVRGPRPLRHPRRVDPHGDAATACSCSARRSRTTPSIATYVPTIQVDFDRMMLGKFHPVDVPLWGEHRPHARAAAGRGAGAQADPAQRASIAKQWARWRTEKRRPRRSSPTDTAACTPLIVFAQLSDVVPEDAVIAVDVGNNTYSFGRYFECRRGQSVLMSGYLGSIGFALPGGDGSVGRDRRHAAARSCRSAATAASASTSPSSPPPCGTRCRSRTCCSNNGELGKISKEQIGAMRPVWQTQLVNPDFAEYARLCGARGWRVEDPSDVSTALAEAMAVTDGPTLVEIVTSARDV